MKYTVLLALTLLGNVFGQLGPQTDFSKVKIETTQIAPSFFIVNGQEGRGTIGVLTGPDGILMVDGQFAVLTDRILAAMKQISTAPIKYMINTHVHPDHTGGNENFAKMGVTIFSRDELRARLNRPARNGTPGTPAAALPIITYSGTLTFHMNGEDVEAIPIPKAHTDGDTLVRFPGINVLMVGDYFRSVGYPNIDRGGGGSLQGMIDGLEATYKLCNATTKIIPGHGEIVDRNALLAQRDMLIGIRDKIAPMVAQGKTLPEVLAAKPTADYDAKVPGGIPATVERLVSQIYAELKK